MIDSFKTFITHFMVFTGTSIEIFFQIFKNSIVIVFLKKGESLSN